MYGCGGGRGTFSDRNPGRGSGGSNRGHGGGRLTNFQCQICLKDGHTANFCHFKTDISFQPHESLTFFYPTMLQPIPYFTGSTISSNTWVNPNANSTIPGPSQPSAMLTNSSSHDNGASSSTWIPDAGVSFHVTGDSQNIK